MASHNKIAEIAAAREHRIALYADRAARGLGIFTGLPIPKEDNPGEEDSQEEAADCADVPC